MFHLYYRNFFEISKWVFDQVFLQELSYKDTMEIGPYSFCKINFNLRLFRNDSNPNSW